MFLPQFYRNVFKPITNLSIIKKTGQVCSLLQAFLLLALYVYLAVNVYICYTISPIQLLKLILKE